METPVFTVAEMSLSGLRTVNDPPFVERIADKVRTLAAVKPALVRLLEWQIDQELELIGEQGEPRSPRAAR